MTNLFANIDDLRRTARDLRIGDPVNFTPVPPTVDQEVVKELHELCIHRPTPHVHIVTNYTSACKGFGATLGRK